MILTGEGEDGGGFTKVYLVSRPIIYKSKQKHNVNHKHDVADMHRALINAISTITYTRSVLVTCIYLALPYVL